MTLCACHHSAKSHDGWGCVIGDCRCDTPAVTGRLYPLQEFTPDELDTFVRFELAEPAPESYVQQHRAEGDCFCQPEQVGQDAWQHKP